MGNPWKITIYHRNTYRKPIYKWAVFPSHASLLKGIIKLDWSYLEFTDFRKKKQEATVCIGYSGQKKHQQQQEFAELVYVKRKRTECASQT